jgi:nucleoside-diphosphate-sugar epimerase
MMGWGVVTIEGSIVEAEIPKGLTHIFHLAGYGDPRKAERYKERLIEANVDATLRLAKVPARLICASSMCVGLSNLWAEVKSQGEQCLLEHHDVVVARMGNVYGPRMFARQDTRVVPTFVRSVTHGLPVTITSDRQESFCWVGDMCRALIGLALSSAQGVVEVGSTQKMTPLELYRAICELKQFSPHYTEAIDPTLTEYHAHRKIPNLERMTLYTDWNARVPLSDGLTQMIAAAELDRLAQCAS